ncbi:hypothetical protein A4G20_10265 [Pasteurellaceae bacterium RH1A]|nr:hypothetical protein A4G20_10265 [Pasteurellaceae bacterium RH1A]
MLWTIFLVQLVGLLSPGPDFFYVSRKAASSTTRNALLGSLGICIGVGVWAVVALFGLAFLSKSADLVQYIIMVLGGGFLVRMGIKMVQVRENAQFKVSQEKIQPTSAWTEIKNGLMVNISNAKIAVFFSSVMSGYVSQLNQLSDLLAVLAILVFSALVYFILLVFLFSRSKVRQFYSKYSRYIDNGAGLIFILFGGELIYHGLVGIFASY